MSHEIVFSAGAEKNFVEIIYYIARDNPARARSFARNLRKRVYDKIASFPNSGTAIGQRRYTVFGNYVIVYRVDDDARVVYVQLVTEGHRDWQRLLDRLA